ncbi:MAG: hypothetical protein Q7T13_01690 [Polaromonas sp.]|nr:hypothetical protein [Polaromonas sp.]
MNDDIDRVVLMLQDVRADSPSLIEFEGIVISVENNAEAAEASATAAAASAAASLASADIAEEAAAEALATSAATAAAAADAAAISASAAASAASAASSASASASASAAAGSAAAAAASASIMDPATATPLQTSGAGVVGTAVKYAREDHAHPELATSSVTETKLATAVKPIGVGQTWQVVTGSRALSTTYTNSTGRPIQVAVTTIGTANGSSTQLYFDVNGVTVHRSGTVLGAGGAVAGPNVCLVVPDGATYAVTTSQGAIAIWAELR